MAGYDYSKWRDWYLYAKSTGSVSDKVPILSSGTVFTASNTDTQEALVSYYARANYSFKDKYLLGLTVRADGSSKFAEGHKWGYFPAASVGWIVSDESFWDKCRNTSNFLKLRASYGLTGNNGIGLYDAYGAYSTSSLYDGSSVTVASSMQNKDLTWERTSQLDLGFDVNFLNDRIRVTADYYNKRTRDMLFNVTLPDTGSFDSVMANVGSARFYGFELALHTVNIERKDFYWGTDITWSFNKNKVLSLDDSYKYKNLDGKDAWRIGGYTMTQTGENSEESLWESLLAESMVMLLTISLQVRKMRTTLTMTLCPRGTEERMARECPDVRRSVIMNGSTGQVPPLPQQVRR